MSLKAMSSLAENHEARWFGVSGLFVGIVLNIALHARPYNFGGIAGGLLSALLVYLLT
jgi:hypothetical protein